MKNPSLPTGSSSNGGGPCPLSHAQTHGNRTPRSPLAPSSLTTPCTGPTVLELYQANNDRKHRIIWKDTCSRTRVNGQRRKMVISVWHDWIRSCRSRGRYWDLVANAGQGKTEIGISLADYINRFLRSQSRSPEMIYIIQDRDAQGQTLVSGAQSMECLESAYHATPWECPPVACECTWSSFSYN